MDLKQLFPSKDRVLTLEFKNDSLRLALIQTGKASSILAVESCPPDMSPAERAERIKFLVGRAGQRLKSRILILGREEVILRNLKIETLSSNSPESEVRERILQLIPFDRHEVVSDYRFLSKSKEGSHEICLVAGHRRIVDEKTRWFSEIPLVPDEAIFSSEAIFLACREKKFRYIGPSSVLLLDVDDESSEILFVNQNEFVFSKKFDLGKAAYESADPVVFSKFFHELDILLQDSPGKLKALAKRVVISGALPKNRALEDKIKEYFGLDPLRLSLEGQESVDFSLTSLFGAAFTGASWHSLNLLPDEFKAEKKKGERALALNQILRLVSGILGLLLLWSVLHWGSRSLLLGNLEDRVQRLKPKTLALEETALALRFKKEESQTRWLLLETLAKLHQMTSSKIYFKNLSYERGKGLVIRGEAETNNEVTNFFNQIRQLPRTSGWNLDYSRKKRTADAAFDFQVHFDLAGDAHVH